MVTFLHLWVIAKHGDIFALVGDCVHNFNWYGNDMSIIIPQPRYKLEGLELLALTYRLVYDQSIFNATQEIVIIALSTSDNILLR